MFTTLARLLVSSRRPPHRRAQAHIEVRQLEEKSVPASLYWVNEGTDTNWSTVANWRLGSITGLPATAAPGPGDDLHFSGELALSQNPPNPNNAPYMESSYNIASLTIESRPAQQYSLTLDGTLEISVSAQMNAGVLTGPGPMTINSLCAGSFAWNSGTIKTTVNVNAGSTLAMSGINAVRTLNGRINLNGANGNWDGQGTFTIAKQAGAQDAVFNIDSGGTFGITRQDGNAQIDMTANAYFDNYGTFNVSMKEALDAPWSPNMKLWFPGQGLVRNYGTMNLQSGDIGTRYLQNAATINIITPFSTFGMGVGNVAGTNGWTELDAGSVTGTPNGGKAEFLGDSTVEITGGTATIRWVIDKCAEVKGSGDLLVTGKYVWGAVFPPPPTSPRTSHWTGTGKMQIGAGQNQSGELMLASNVSFKSGRSIINYGYIEWECFGPQQFATFTLEMEGAAGIENKAGATILLSQKGTAAQKITGPVNAGKFTNAGTLDVRIEKSVDIDLPFDNLGGNIKATGTGLPAFNLGRKVIMGAGWIEIDNPVQAVFAGGIEQIDGLITNAGKIEVDDIYTLSGGALNSTGRVDVVGIFNFFGGTASFSGTYQGASLVADSVLQTGGLLTASNTALLQINGAYGQVAGTVQLNHSVANVGTNWSIGQYAALFGSTSSIGKLNGYGGDLINAGTLEIGLINGTNYQNDSLGVGRDYTQTSTGKLILDAAIDGYLNNNNEKLNVTNAATFAGTFQLRVPTGISVPMGWAFQLITYASASGNFGTYILPPGGWMPDYTAMAFRELKISW
jgi:hypothetical protein